MKFPRYRQAESMDCKACLQNAIMTLTQPLGIKKIFLYVVLILLISTASYSQHLSYDTLVVRASKAYDKGDFKKAIELYAEVIKAGKKNHSWEESFRCYYLACAYAASHQNDSAYVWLSKSIDRGMTNEKYLFDEPNLKSLYVNKDTLALLKSRALHKQQQKDRVAKFKKNVLLMWKEDQAIRMAYEQAKYEAKPNSKALDSLDKKRRVADSLHITYVDHYLDSAGFIGSDLIGIEATLGLSMMILHSNNLRIDEKYYALFKQHNFPESDLCYMYDKIMYLKGMTQKYGTQFIYNPISNCYEIYPIESLEKIEEYRKEAELESWETYKKKFVLCH